MPSNQVVVIDTGGDTIKAGFSGESGPRTCLQTLVGHESDFSLIGDALAPRKEDSSLKMSRPVERGFVKNWADLELLYEHVYETSLGVESDDFSAILSEPVGNSSANREKLAQLMFEKFKIPRLCLQNQAVCSLLSCHGRTNGLVVDCGHTVTHVASVCEGHVLNHSIERYNVAGRDITSYLASLLSLEDKSLAQSLKEDCCYVYDLVDESHRNESLDYTLPDGKVVILGKERHLAPEILFDPALVDLDIMGLHQIVYKTIAKTQIDLRRELYANICVCGGSALLDGFDRRMRAEVKALAPSTVNVNVVANEETRRFAGWIGASLLASMDDFAETCVSLGDYRESGASIVTRMFS